MRVPQDEYLLSLVEHKKEIAVFLLTQQLRSLPNWTSRMSSMVSSTAQSKGHKGSSLCLEKVPSPPCQNG